MGPGDSEARINFSSPLDLLASRSLALQNSPEQASSFAPENWPSSPVVHLRPIHAHLHQVSTQIKLGRCHYACCLPDTDPHRAIVAAQTPTKTVVTSWARGSHELGRTVVYPRLPVAVGLEPASAVTLSSCTDNNDIIHRMLAKHEVIDAKYEQASVPVILGQLRMAGIRLAAVIKAAYP